LFKAAKLENLDQIILEDYYRAKHKNKYWKTPKRQTTP
jgi:hypothetical protein